MLLPRVIYVDPPNLYGYTINFARARNVLCTKKHGLRLLNPRLVLQSV